MIIFVIVRSFCEMSKNGKKQSHKKLGLRLLRHQPADRNDVKNITVLKILHYSNTPC